MKKNLKEFNDATKCYKVLSNAIKYTSQYVREESNKSVKNMGGDLILLGDSDTDIEAAEKVGVQSVKVCSKYTLTHWTRDFLLN